MEIIISPYGQIEAEWILSYAISHLYANARYYAHEREREREGGEIEVKKDKKREFCCCLLIFPTATKTQSRQSYVSTVVLGIRSVQMM